MPRGAARGALAPSRRPARPGAAARPPARSPSAPSAAAALTQIPGLHPPARFPGSAPARLMRYSGFGACPGRSSTRLPPRGPRSAHSPLRRGGTYTARGRGRPAPPRRRRRGSWQQRAPHAAATCAGLTTGGEPPPRAARPPSGGGCGGAEHAQWRRRGCGCPHLPPGRGFPPPPPPRTAGAGPCRPPRLAGGPRAETRPQPPQRRY